MAGTSTTAATAGPEVLGLSSAAPAAAALATAGVDEDGFSDITKGETVAVIAAVDVAVDEPAVVGNLAEDKSAATTGDGTEAEAPDVTLLEALGVAGVILAAKHKFG